MRTIIFALLFASSAWAQKSPEPAKTVPAQGPPPKHLTVRPDGHVSANEDPRDRDKFEVHVVQKGETLSAIAGDVMKNPLLWPQLWEQNEHIVNPHWIYPNDVILVKPVTVLAEAKPPETEPDPAPAPPPVPEAKPAPAPPAPAEPPRRPVQLAPPPPPPPPTLVVEQQKPAPEIKYDDLYCSGSVRTGSVPDDLKVLARFDAEVGALASQADYVYLSQGANNGIMAGAMYQVIRPTRRVKDLGMHYLDVAQLKVILVQPDYSLARIVHACADAVDAGDILAPFERISFPQPSRPRQFSEIMTTSGDVQGKIVTTKDVLLNTDNSFKTTGKVPGVSGGRLGPLNRGIAGEGAIVYVSIEGDQTVKPGDVLIAYRNVKIDHRLYKYPSEASKLEGRARRAVGELVVVKSDDHAATALVTYSTDGLMFGDAVERR